MSVLSFDPARRALSRGTPTRPLTIGLVNNMPDKALRGTERQYQELLAQAAGDRLFVLRVFSLPGLARSAAGQQHVRDNHEDIDELWDADLDGLIVTGTEPRAAALKDEPYWPVLTQLIDWAAEHTVSTVWSCLAAHAAVHHLDGIDRHPCGAKLSGVYGCHKAAEHPLVARSATHWCTPHSRYNGVREQDLDAHGYTVLSRAAAAGADIFIKHLPSLFVFLQGHPEYDADALLREYRRDVGRYLTGERDGYPDVPVGYFDDGAAAAMLAFRSEAMRRRNAELMADFPLEAAQRSLTGPWLPAARRLYTNWLAYLDEQRVATPSFRGVRAKSGATAKAIPAYG